MVLFNLLQGMSSTARDSAAQKAEFAALIEAAKSRMHQVVQYSKVSSTVICVLGKDGFKTVMEKSLWLLSFISHWRWSEIKHLIGVNYLPKQPEENKQLRVL